MKPSIFRRGWWTWGDATPHTCIADVRLALRAFASGSGSAIDFPPVPRPWRRGSGCFKGIYGISPSEMINCRGRIDGWGGIAT